MNHVNPKSAPPPPLKTELSCSTVCQAVQLQDVRQTSESSAQNRETLRKTFPKVGDILEEEYLGVSFIVRGGDTGPRDRCQDGAQVARRIQ